jgi:hypothetical protein
MNKLQQKYYLVSQKLELIIQDQDYDSPYWDYLLKLRKELSSKGFLLPSECKKIMNWTLTIY